MSENFIDWNENYATGIPLIDIQNKTLVRKINGLYSACSEDTKAINQHFFQATHEAVDYVRFHFRIEENLMYMLEFSDRIDHKKEHENFTKEILIFFDWFNQGEQLAPYHFVKFLKNWVQSHIAVSDKVFADFFLEMKKYAQKELIQVRVLKELPASVKLSQKVEGALDG